MQLGQREKGRYNSHAGWPAWNAQLHTASQPVLGKRLAQCWLLGGEEVDKLHQEKGRPDYHTVWHAWMAFHHGVQQPWLAEEALL